VKPKSTPRKQTISAEPVAKKNTKTKAATPKIEVIEKPKRTTKASAKKDNEEREAKPVKKGRAASAKKDNEEPVAKPVKKGRAASAKVVKKESDNEEPVSKPVKKGRAASAKVVKKDNDSVINKSEEETNKVVKKRGRKPQELKENESSETETVKKRGRKPAATKSNIEPQVTDVFDQEISVIIERAIEEDNETNGESKTPEIPE
jgi:hypothetical protein